MAAPSAPDPLSPEQLHEAIDRRALAQAGLGVPGGEWPRVRQDEGP
jgi:hypothetical protein